MSLFSELTMKALTGLVFLLFVSLVTPSPITDGNETLTIDKDFFAKEFVKYKSEHDIVNILVPINSLNFDENESSESDSKEKGSKIVFFFVEADVTKDGKRIDQGLYMFKDNMATKLLDHGRDAAASGDDSKSVFFGAKDGIYIYKDGKTEKYGPITDSIIQIAKEKSGDVLYILTENHELYKVSDNGNKKEKIEDVGHPQEFVIDYSNNIYFYALDKEVKVRTSEGIKKIVGLPENPSDLKLLNPPFVIDDGVPVLIDGTIYTASANGSSEAFGIDVDAKYKPTAYASEATFIQYYAYDKKIYEFNFVTMMLGTVLEDMKEVVEKNEDTIRSLASQKHSIKAKKH